ncbi:MAG: hypothetical protein HY907_15140 [Deltaproteobacteria bacterium]|nr:hypothetical protein [Deltaproteobacteria bacterium]
MGLIVSPIVEGKLAAWEELVEGITGPRKEEFADFNRRYSLTRHAVWLAKLPQGWAAVVLIEGPGAGDFLPRITKSTHDFDRWLSSRLAEVHGIDVSMPPPGSPPELKFDVRL